LRSQDHYLPLLLNAKLRLALIKLQYNMELGTSYAGLYALNEGLHALKYLSDEDYEFFKRRYSDKLVCDDSNKKALEIDQQARKENEEMTKYFREILMQWDTHPNLEWRKYQFKKAKEYANRIPNAKLILDLEKNA
jgi:hypothetical protein